MIIVNEILGEATTHLCDVFPPPRADQRRGMMMYHLTAHRSHIISIQEERRADKADMRRYA